MSLTICFICDEYPPISHGGIGTEIKLLAEELAKTHRVYVVGISPKSFGGKDFEEINRVQVWRFKHGIKLPFIKRNSLIYKMLNKLLNLDYLGIKKTWIKHHEFIEKLNSQKSIDVIESTDFRFAFNHLPFDKNLNMWPNVKGLKVTKLHGSINFLRLEEKLSIDEKAYFFEKKLFQNSEKIISVSPYTTKKFKAYYNLNHNKIKTIFNGLYISKGNIFEARKNEVIFSGSLVKKKGIIELLKAWNLVCQVNKDVVLKIYGKGTKQKFFKYINNDFKKRVFFEGHVDRIELLQEYKKARLAIFPSHFETFGLAPVESMMMGCPTIGSKIFEKTWYTQNKDTPAMLIQDEFDIDSFAGLIIKVLDDEILRKNLSHAGISYVKNHFDIRNIAKMHVDFYSKNC
jgi:glycosyltransferase involved in cell wall biosynthesis